MAERITQGMELFGLQGTPQTFLVNCDVKTGKAVGLVPITRGIDGKPPQSDFSFPVGGVGMPPARLPTDMPPVPAQVMNGRDANGVYITDGAASPKHVHPALLDSFGYTGVTSGVMAVMDGVEVIQPVYDMVAVQGYLMSNAWHYAAVKAKATAATELGYTWVYEKKARKGILQPQTKILSDFEDRIYERNHKDLATILKDQAMDFFSTGNKTTEIAYNMGGTVDCIYAVPAITVFRHPIAPVAVQAIPDHERWSTLFDDRSRGSGSGLEVKAILPLFMSGLHKGDLQTLFPDAPSELMTNNELVHVTNSVISIDPIYGVADILPALSAMMGDNAANAYNWQFFENNAIPRYAVTVTGGRVSRDVSDKIQTFFNREIQGQAHRTIVIPLPRDMTATFQALDATQNEASFIEFKKLNRAEIAAVHSVPPSEIGLWEDANKANSNQQARNYFLKVIRPYQAKDEAMMNRILIQGLRIEGVRFRFKNVEYTDDQERATVAKTKADAFRQYVDGISNTLKTLNELTGASSSSGSKNPTDNNNSLSSSNRSAGSASDTGSTDTADNSKAGKGKSKNTKNTADSTGEADTAKTAPVPEKEPLMTVKEARPLVKQLIQQALDAAELFELDNALDTYD